MLSKLSETNRVMVCACCAWRSLAFLMVLFQRFSPTSSLTRLCTARTSDEYSGCPIRFRTTHSWTIWREEEMKDSQSVRGRFKQWHLWLNGYTQALVSHHRSYLCRLGSEGRIFLFKIVEQNFDKNKQFLSARYIVTRTLLRYLMSSWFCSFLAAGKVSSWHDDWCFGSTWLHDDCELGSYLWQFWGVKRWSRF